MLYPGIPFTQKVRAELRSTISSHPKWKVYRKFTTPTVPHLNAMTREDLLRTADALDISVKDVIEASGARTGRIYRKGFSELEHRMRTNAVLKLRELGYSYAGEKWQKKPVW